ncbi:MAG: DUF4215 domain-containing protein [Kofleriaceae bacterium]|nr:DUF4215 domain-containing protein [Myxococcales bacterium]MCB9573041.1 DUF4215 domain-containing protein [Kofleriaceae bacterium]
MTQPTHRLLAAIALAGAATFTACGSDPHGNPDIDAAVDDHDATIHTTCGNAEVEPGEDCDDGDLELDSACDATCHFTCGNGVVDDSVGERCDTGIATGDGACPTACDDGDACTSDILSGTGCEAECLTPPITVPTDGDGCCPAGADATNDSDCAAECGNGVVEPGELCDTGIATGLGACPTACDDGMSCTTDTLTGTGCTAACETTPITTPSNGDGCCPAGANSTTDDDCLPGCGNGVLEAGEACDTGIADGPGSCPTSCSDGMACTQDVLVDGGTCGATCTFPPVTQPMGGDGCCPAGANANNDSDCAPSCGNGVVEAGEACDDGNTSDGDACSSTCQLPPVAFRFSDLDLRDPHVFVSFIGCRDVTDTQLLGFSVNNELQTSIQTDDDGDGFLGLSPTLVFPSFQQTAATQPVDIHFAQCTAPMAGTSCSPGTSVTPAIATYQSAGACLAPLAGTLGSPSYSPSITSPSGTCFSTSTVTITLSLGGIPITLHDARIAASYVGNPATTLTNGLLMGFISEADADATIIPSSFPLVGGQPLSSLLPGGDPPGSNNTNCASRDDKDLDGGVTGWWFYMNFPATKVTWTP